MKRRPGNTTKEQIVAYWSTRLEDDGGEVALGSWKEGLSTCWRCVDKTYLERCHIVGYALGGEDVASNYVLLCVKCHKEAPDVPDREVMLQWIKQTKSTMPEGWFWSLRTIREAMALGAIPDEKCDIKRFERIMRRCGTHQGRFTPASVAWAIRECRRKPGDGQLRLEDAV